MKILVSSIFVMILSFSCYSQDNGKDNLNLVFYDECSGEKITPEFEIFTLPELNYKYLTVFREVDNWNAQYTSVIKTSNDTINIPKILFAGGNELHSTRWTYLNCEKVCNGFETDFYANGNKRLEGKFKNGKPSEIKEYRKNGVLQTQSFYENYTMNHERINYFNENGELTEYQIYKNRKRKSIIKTFDKNGILTHTEIEKKYLVK